MGQLVFFTLICATGVQAGVAAWFDKMQGASTPQERAAAMLSEQH